MLLGRQRHFLIGPRRFGKTSILSTAALQARKAKAIVIQVNAEEFATQAAMVSNIVAQSAAAAGWSLKRSLVRTRELFGQLRPSVAYDPIQDSWTANLTVAEEVSGTTLITEALEGLERLGTQEKRPVALIMDEFQHLVTEGGIVAERQLRAVVQRHRNVGYVFAGSDESMLSAMTGEHDRPFYRLGSRRFLGPVPRADFADYLQKAFAKTNATLDPLAIERIFELSRDVPYSIQRLALECWRRVRQSGGTNAEKTVDVALVEDRMSHLLQVESPGYAQLSASLTSVQLRTLVFFAHQGPQPFQWQTEARKRSMAVSSFKRATEALVARSLIRVVRDGNPVVRYAFEDPFFGEWVGRVIKG